MVQRRKLVYLVLYGMTPESEDDEIDSSLYGVFSKRKKAEESIPDHDKNIVSYFIVETGLDELFDQNEGLDEDQIQDVLIELMNDGLVEQLVDEDGKFVYQAIKKE